MANRFNVQQGGPYPHFITTTIVRWYPTFISSPYFDIVLESMKHLQSNRGLLIHCYVIMPTHLHAIVTAANDDLSEIIRDFKRFTARRIYNQSEADGNRLQSWVFKSSVAESSKATIKVWQDEFHPEVVKGRDFFLQKANYIHNNPFRKGLVDCPNKYYYSSAAAFETGDAGPLAIDWIEW